MHDSEPGRIEASSSVEHGCHARRLPNVLGFGPGGLGNVDPDSGITSVGIEAVFACFGHRVARKRQPGNLAAPVAIREALIKFHMRDRGDSGRGQDGEDAV